MSADRWDVFFDKWLDAFSCEQGEIDPVNRIPEVTSYCVRSFDGDALLFSVPLLIRRQLLSEIALDPAGADGTVSCLIEQIKQRTDREPALGPLAGNGTGFPHHYDTTIEPYTLVHSDDALATHLWHADTRN
jgi:predicted ABC-class ATPase